MAFNIVGDIQSLTLEQLTLGYKEDKETNKVVAWRDTLQVRPEYQRQFVYDDEQQKEVIYSILNNRPLGIMYFAKDGVDYEVMDGQQRIMSICKFRMGEFSIEWNGIIRTYDLLSTEIKNRFNNYQIKYYICEGDYQDKLQWFKTINIGGEPLSNQELRNALCGGEWVNYLKKTFSNKEYFSKYKELLPDITKDDSIYLNRFVVLEIILGWLIDYEDYKAPRGTLDVIMSFMEHYKKSREDQAKIHVANFEKICQFAREKFNLSNRDFQRILRFKKVNWGKLAKVGTDKTYKEIDEECHNLIENGEIDKTGNICEYIIFGDKKILYNRFFSEDKKLKVWLRQGGRCGNKNCPNPNVMLDDCHAHHKIAFEEGGPTTIENCVILCKDCHKKWHNSDNSKMELL